MHSRLKYSAAAIGCFLAIALFLTKTGFAQESDTLDAVYAQAGLDQKLGEFIPGDLAFFDETGQSVVLDDYLNKGKPVVLTLGYHNCPMLCNMLLDGFTSALQDVEWLPGKEFEILTVSISPEETPELAAERKAHYLDALGRTGSEAGWHYLTGKNAEIEKLASAVGFRYAWIEEIGQYVHPAIVTVLTPEGQVSRYLQGFRFNPRDIRLALVEASGGEVGTPIDFVTLYCLQYDPDKSAYVVHAANLMRLGGALTVLLLGVMLFTFWRREG